VFFFFSMARPIALALAFEAIALNFWLRWMSNPTKINSRVSLIALILAFYTHHTHGTILLVLYTLVFISWLKRDTRSLPAFRTLLLPATICILPVALSIILHVAQSPDSLVFLKAPTLSALLAEIVPLPIACVLLVTLFLRIIGKIELMRPSLNSSTYTIMVATSCLVVPPVALYLASSLFHTSAFAPRALGLSKIGASILAGYGLSSITTKRARGSLTMAVALISLSTSLIRLEAPCRFPYLYQQITNPDETALFYGSGFLESVRPDFLYSGEYQGHFISPLTYYPPPASVGFLPTHAFYESTSRYVSALIRLHMGAKNKAALIRHDFSEPISQTFNTEMTRLGFHKIASTSGGSIFLEQYERASEDTPETLPPVSTELPLIVVRGDDD
ncbi:MAG: hypothetical protein KDD60_09740, partial [Bdellovibrionales bacterium]|nr:hypothetical protein [Bdellovibrionales bacterium]